MNDSSKMVLITVEEVQADMPDPYFYFRRGGRYVRLVWKEMTDGREPWFFVSTTEYGYRCDTIEEAVNRFNIEALMIMTKQNSS